MDYEKLYKKALERASKLRVQNPFDTVSQMMEYVFPELAESEEERIRKEIISHLQHEYVVKRYVSDVEYDRWIAWLEKQGEQKPQGKTALESAKEEKVDNANKIEPKWSDEDEEHFQHALLAIRTSQFYTEEDREELVYWLKSLKQRMEE